MGTKVKVKTPARGLSTSSARPKIKNIRLRPAKGQSGNRPPTLGEKVPANTGPGPH